MKRNRKKQFFTLLEVLVSMGVFSILMLALMQFFSAAQTAWERSGGKAELFDSARIATQLLYNDLSVSFYGDENHEMGDAADKFIFYKSGTDDGKFHLTFAAMRADGLTEVNYVWNPSDLTLSIQELCESSTDPAPSLGASGWVNFPSNAWINSLRSQNAAVIADDVLMFDVRNYFYNNSTTPPNDSAKYRPPALVFITFAVLSPAGYEKLDAIIRPTASGSTDEAKTAAVKSQIKTYFDAMRGSGDKFPDNAVPESGSDVPAKQILFDNVQFFKVMVPIERG